MTVTSAPFSLDHGAPIDHIALHKAVRALSFSSGVLEVRIEPRHEGWNNQIGSPWNVILERDDIEFDRRTFSRGELMAAFGPRSESLPPQHQKFVYDNGADFGAIDLFLRKDDVTLVFVSFVSRREGGAPGVYFFVDDKLQTMVSLLLSL